MKKREVQPYRCIGDGMPAGQKTKALFFIRTVLCARYVLKMLCADCPVLNFEKARKNFKDQADKGESIKRAVSRNGKQANSLNVFATAKNQATEASFRKSEYECGWWG